MTIPGDRSALITNQLRCLPYIEHPFTTDYPGRNQPRKGLKTNVLYPRMRSNHTTLFLNAHSLPTIRAGKGSFCGHQEPEIPINQGFTNPKWG